MSHNFHRTLKYSNHLIWFPENKKLLRYVTVVMICLICITTLGFYYLDDTLL